MTGVVRDEQEGRGDRRGRETRGDRRREREQEKRESKEGTDVESEMWT